MTPSVSFLSLFCYFALSLLLQELFLQLISLFSFLQDSCVPSPTFWCHLSSSSSATSLASVPPSPSGPSRCPHINAACGQASFSDPPSHLTTPLVTSKGQGRGEVDSCLAGNGGMLELGGPGIGCCRTALNSDPGWESRLIAVGFCCVCWVASRGLG